ncbi:MAG TPA: chorismate-binding protein [Bdellovibrionota bacterium]|jgi:isochorismate synthase EntC
MSTPFDFQRWLTSESRCYAWSEPGQGVRLRWGETEPSADESLSFRKFFSPRQKFPSAWIEFPESAAWALAKGRTIEQKTLADVMVSRPRSEIRSDRPAWDALCQTVQAQISAGFARKLVPAREVSCEVSPEEYSDLLSSIGHRLFAPFMSNAYRFIVKSGSSVFFGATPELLFSREGGKILIHSIAGTRPLPDGTQEEKVSAELLASAKDRAEHAWVVQGIRESLRGLDIHLTHPTEPRILRVPGLLHLYTPMTADDDPAIPGERLIDALHPTPAIGGWPREGAMNFLFEQETWDRGLFSAPLLIRSPGRELCLVGIRSGLLTRNSLHFFAGAGYVSGSDPGSEWDETERKLGVMQKILFGEQDGR